MFEKLKYHVIATRIGIELVRFRLNFEKAKEAQSSDNLPLAIRSVEKTLAIGNRVWSLSEKIDWKNKEVFQRLWKLELGVVDMLYEEAKRLQGESVSACVPVS